MLILGLSTIPYGPGIITGSSITIYHDGEYKVFDADVEVTVPFAGKLPNLTAGIIIKTIRGGMFASTKRTIKDVLESLGKEYYWTAKKGFEPESPSCDYYQIDPNEVQEE